MVRIRLSRSGAKGRPFYHVVAVDQRDKRDGRSLERLGYFNPISSGADKRLVLDVDKVDAWVAKGARMSDKVRSLVKQARKQQAAEPVAASETGATAEQAAAPAGA